MSERDVRDLLHSYSTPEPLDPTALSLLADDRSRHRRQQRIWLAAACGALVLTAGALGRHVLAEHTDRSVTELANPSTATPQPTPATSTPPAVGVLPDRTWVQIGPGYWFYTADTQWCIAQGPTHPKGTPAATTAFLPFGCRATIGNANLAPASELGDLTSSGLPGQIIASSRFPGTPATTTIQVQGHTYPGRLWRLAGIPGWNLAVWIYPYKHTERAEPIPRVTITTYDAAGHIQGQYRQPDPFRHK